jgi:hypothetical protein
MYQFTRSLHDLQVGIDAFRFCQRSLGLATITFF